MRLRVYHEGSGLGGPMQETVRALLEMALHDPITKDAVVRAAAIRGLAEMRSMLFDRVGEFMKQLEAEVQMNGQIAKDAADAARALEGSPEPEVY